MNSIGLIPVLELQPSLYATQEHPAPTVSGAEDPQGWERYWRACLADAGLEGIPPALPGSWLVPLADLQSEQLLEAILRVELDNCGDLDELPLSALSGGYLLTWPGGAMPPQCCGDLANLDEWRSASEHQSSDWAMLWMGHPWTHVSADGDKLSFLQPSETDPPAAENVAVTIDRAQLHTAIESAAGTVAAFAERLRQPLQAQLPENLDVNAILQQLTRGG